MFENIHDNRLQSGSPIGQTRLVELYLLNVFDALCKAHELKYWLDYGTLLGARRHRGFIPWDDDIDVSMPIDDYRKFIRIAKDELPQTIILQDMGKVPNAKHSYLKLRDRKSFFCEGETDVRVPCGIFIDIFPAIKAPNLPKKFINFICWVQYTCARHGGASLGEPRLSAMRKILDCFMCLFYRSIKAMFGCLYEILVVIFPSNQWRANKDLAEKFILDESDIFPLVKIEFEGDEYNAPNKVDNVLEKEYGDWRTLPPPDKRFRHATILSPTIPPPVDWAI